MLQEAPAPYLDENDNPIDAPDEVFMLPAECNMYQLFCYGILMIELSFRSLGVALRVT